MDQKTRYLDYGGLLTYHGKLKLWVEDKLNNYESLRTMLYADRESIEAGGPLYDCLFVTTEGKMYVWVDDNLQLITGQVLDQDLVNWIIDTLVNKNSVLVKTDRGFRVAIDEEKNEENFLKVSDRGIYISGLKEYIDEMGGKPGGFATLDDNCKVEQDHYLITEEDINNINWLI